MTSPEPYTREKLIELAALDAFGLLDDYEAAHFTRSFHDASANDQDEIRRIQAEVAGDVSLLPDEEPDSSLRQRVLDVVARTMDDAAAPLATIGRTHSSNGQGRIVLGTSGQLWRAAAFVLAGVGVVMTYFWAESQRESIRIMQMVLSNVTHRQLIQHVGPSITEFLSDPTAERVVLTPPEDVPEDPEGSARWASVFVLETGAAFLVFEGLPQSEDGEYTIQLAMEDGTTRQLRSFDSTGNILGGIRFEAITAAATMVTTATWQIVNSSGEVLLTS